VNPTSTSQKDKVLSKVRRIPSMPTSALKIIQLLQDPNVSIHELLHSIEYDPGMTSNVLRVANSPYFGSPKSISSLKEAVTRLGTNNIYKMAVASVVSSMMQSPVRGYDLAPGQLWEHSIAVALCCEKIAGALKIKAPMHAFTAALLHDVGKIVLGTFLEVDAGPILELVHRERLSFEVAENRVLGIDHAEVGACLLEHWNLPPDIVDVVRWHHQPEQFKGNPVTVELVHIADAITVMEGIGAGRDELNYRPSETVISKLKLKTRAIESIICETMSALDDVRAQFTMFVPTGGYHGTQYPVGR
jgi:putative nucleotidyltransferase with HDIG domain